MSVNTRISKLLEAMMARASLKSLGSTCEVLTASMASVKKSRFRRPEGSRTWKT